MIVGIDCRKAADFGIGTYIRGLLAGLRDLRTDDQFVLLAPQRLFGLLPDAPNFRKVPQSSPHYSIRELIAVGQAAGREHIDVFHAPHYVVPFVAAPVVTTIHDLIHLKVVHRNPLKPLYAAWMMRRAVGKSAAILVGTEAVRKDLEWLLPAAATKTHVTRFGAEPFFNPGPPDLATLQSLGLDPGQYFLFLGNDKPHKNLDRLVEAWRVVHRDRPGLRLVLAGGASRFEEPGVIQTGFASMETLLALLRGALALVQPSLEEGFGMPVVEAMAAGTAVIISDQPALREVAGEAALVVDPLSISSIAGAMERLASDPAVRARLIAAGANRALDFSWATCAEATLKVYAEAMRGPVR